MKRACVLSGGGVKGAFQVGALLKPEIQSSFVDKWFGISTGSLQGIMMAQARDVVEQAMYTGILYEVYRKIKSNKDIYTGPSNNFTKGIALLNMQFSDRQSLFEPKGLRSLIRKNVDAGKNIIPYDRFACGVVQFSNRNYHLIEGYRNPFILDYVLASSSMPVYFPPVVISGKPYVDGGLRNQTPLDDAITWLKNYPDEQKELIVILTQPILSKPSLSPITKLLDKLATTLNILTNEVYLNDLEKILTKNEIANGSFNADDYKFIKVKLIHPTTHYDDTLEFDPDRIVDMLYDGMDANIIELEVPYDLIKIP